MSEILDYKEERKDVVAIFLDFCKAFGCVNNSTSIHKLEATNTSGLFLNLLVLFLRNRKQFVVSNWMCLSLKPVSIGCSPGQESSSNPLFYSCHLKNAVPLMPVNAYLCPYISRCKVVRILGCTVPSDFIWKIFWYYISIIKEEEYKLIPCCASIP